MPFIVTLTGRGLLGVGKSFFSLGVTMHSNGIEVLSKLEIAERQLNRAIILLLDEGDVVSSITLSGAAEDVLAGLLNKTDQLTEIIQDCIDSGEMLGEKWRADAFRCEFNYIKNELKHHNKGVTEVPIFSESAHEIIGRACENFRRLTGQYTDQMSRFNSLFL